MVENIPEPQHDIRFERQGEVDGRFEGLLEVALPLVGPVGRRAGVVLPPEVGVTEGYDLGHGLPFPSTG